MTGPPALPGGNHGQVATNDIADSAVNSAKIANGQVGVNEIANDAVDSARVVDDSLTDSDLGPDSVRASELAPSSVSTSELVNGGIQPVDLSAAALGARAYGRVSPNGVLTQSKNAAVTKPGGTTGVYCVSADADPASTPIIAVAEGVAPGVATAVGAADPLVGGSSSESIARQELDADQCTSGREWQIETFRQFVDTASNETGIETSDQAFSFVVP